MRIKKVSDSTVIMTEMVLPNHTNPLGNLLGGQLMLWIDICAALCASKHSQNVCVTASVDKIDFHHSIKLGNAVSLQSSVNRVFGSSMEIGVKVFAESYYDGTKIHSNSAYLTFVNVDKNGKPEAAIQISPETPVELYRFEQAAKRREARLKSKLS